MLVRVDGRLPAGVTAKDLALAIIGRIGTAGGTGHAIEFAGAAIERAVDGRPDDRVQHGDRGRRARGHGRASTTRRSNICAGGRSRRRRSCGTAPSRIGARCAATTARSSTRVVALDASTLAPQVTWGTSPEMVVSIEGRVPDPDKEKDADAPRRHRARARVHGPRAEHADGRHPDRQGVHRLVHQFADRGPARRGGDRARPPRGRDREARAGGARFRARQERRPSARVSTGSSATPASNGASPAARCASR